MLDELGCSYEYREYRENPLSVAELKEVLGLLSKTPRDLLRPRESAAHGIPEDLPDEALLVAMAKEPTLLQRPIFHDGKRAILARPADLLKEFLGGDA